MRSPPPEPYCQPARAFSFVPRTQLISRFVLPLPLGHKELADLPAGSIDPRLFSDEFLAERRAWECSTELDFWRTAKILRQWFSDRDHTPALHGNVVTLTRIFAVLGSISIHHHLIGDDYLDYAKWRVPRLVPVPGGNLATMMWLAWRYVHGYAQVADNLAIRVRSMSDVDKACTLVMNFVTVAGTAPAQDYVRAGDLNLSDEEVFLWRGEKSGRLDRIVRSALSAVNRGEHNGKGRRQRGMSPGLYPIEEPVRSAVHENLDLSQRNFYGYCEAASAVLDGLLNLLFVVNHYTALLRRMICPFDPRIGLACGDAPLADIRPLRGLLSRMGTALRQVLEYKASFLDGHFIDSARLTGVQPSFWSPAESDMVDWVMRLAAFAVPAVWGILPGEPDSFLRAGPRCRPVHCRELEPDDCYKDPPDIYSVVPERSETHSFGERYRECLDGRVRSIDVPVPVVSKLDRYVWTEPHDCELEGPDSA